MQTTDVKFQLRYLVMPDYLYMDNRLTLIAVKIYCFINTYKNPFFFTNEQLAEMFDCSERNIEKGISLLKELKYIEAKHRNKAGGGKTRLIQTTLEGGLEPHSSVVSDDDSEAANHTTVWGKEKDNILRGNGENLLPSEKRALKEKNKKIGGYSQGRGFTGPTQSGPLKEFPKKGGVVHAEDIV